LKVICSYCRQYLHDSEPYDSEDISHGLCDECSDYFGRQWAGLHLGEFLDRFELPVLALDCSRRVIAANSAMARILGKENREISGLLGGEVLECQYARFPEGCGRTVHCKDCAIRLSVEHTLKTGENLRDVPASLSHKSKEAALLISTTYKGRFVLVEIRDISEPAESSQIKEKVNDTELTGPKN